MFVIRRDDLRSQAARDLVAFHVREMRRTTPACHAFALDESGLLAPDIDVYTAWDGDAIVAMGALRDLHDGTGEIKSMRTHPAYLRRGAAAQILETLIHEASERGYTRVMLETGTTFDAAIALYKRRGFVPCPPYGTYQQSEFNRFFALMLATPKR